MHFSGAPALLAARTTVQRFLATCTQAKSLTLGRSKKVLRSIPFAMYVKKIPIGSPLLAKYAKLH